MFFENNRKELIRVVNLLQRKSCSYDRWSINKESNPPSFCDCKYGYDGNINSESTGCPELRNVEHILSVMTEEEYKMFLERRKIIE